MANQSETTSNDRMEQAREILHVCVEARKRIDTYIRMTEKEQEWQNPEEIARIFEHLFNCDNAWAFQLVIGSTAGSGLCKKKWAELKQLKDRDPQNFGWPVVDHMARIEAPWEWAFIFRGREKQWGKKQTPHHEFMTKHLEEWEQNNKTKKRRKDGTETK